MSSVNFFASVEHLVNLKFFALFGKVPKSLRAAPGVSGIYRNVTILESNYVLYNFKLLHSVFKALCSSSDIRKLLYVVTGTRSLTTFAAQIFSGVPYVQVVELLDSGTVDIRALASDLSKTTRRFMPFVVVVGSTSNFWEECGFADIFLKEAGVPVIIASGSQFARNCPAYHILAETDKFVIGAYWISILKMFVDDGLLR